MRCNELPFVLLRRGETDIESTLACLWAILPLYNAYNFATCPIERLTEGGASLFGLLAMGGDIGASVSPGLVGVVTQVACNNMKAGMLAGCLFPVIIILAIGRICLFAQKHL